MISTNKQQYACYGECLKVAVPEAIGVNDWTLEPDLAQVIGAVTVL